MIFPYLRGLVFCASLTNDGGWKALDDAYREPPALDRAGPPSREVPGRSPTRPRPSTWARSTPAAAGRRLGRNVVGEMQTRRPAPPPRRQDGRRGLGRRPLRRLRRPRRPARPGLALHLGQRGRRPRVRPGLRPLPDDQARRRGPPARRRSPTRSAAPTRGPSSPSSAAAPTWPSSRGSTAETTERLIEAAFKARKAEMTRPPVDKGEDQAALSSPRRAAVSTQSAP